MDTITDVPLEVQQPEPIRPPATGPVDWVHRNLFRSVGDGIVSVVSGVVLLYLVYRALRYVFVTGRWEIVRVNLKLFMVGRYPVDEMWRISLSIALVALFVGAVAGFIARRRVLTGTAEPGLAERPWWQRVAGTALRLWPLLLGTALVLSMVRTSGPGLMVGLTVLGGIAGRCIGPRLPARSGPWLVAVGILGLFGVVAFLSGALSITDWTGVMLNVFLAVAGITLCFPLGVLLALGRRSKLPLTRWLCIIYVELFRGVPLYVLLLLAYVVVPLFLPSSTANPPYVTRAIVAITLFTAAYIAEIVRGGLQSLPRGQTEAAQALGMSPVRITFLIVLPQALRNVIPAIVGQFISLFKDTTLAAAAMGLFDLLVVARSVTSQNAFQGQGLIGETLTFAMLLFWMGCITMSRESQRLERRLGVGTR